MKLYPLFSKKTKKYHTGLVLSGGAARGFAHIGVLKALNKHGIYPDVVSGVSAGALAGVLYCDGYKPGEIYDIFKDKSLLKFATITIPRDGLLGIENLRKVLESTLRAQTFQELQVPFYCNATNMNEGTAEYFHEGELISKVIASASIPVLFKPVYFNNTTYVDGGVADNFPVYPIQDKAEHVIGVHVNPTGKIQSLKSLMKIAERSFHVMVNSRIKEMADSCDLFIQPEGLHRYGLLNAGAGKEMYELGYESTMKILKKKFLKKFYIKAS
ncbi:MAG: patatin-like phospholipase family protein [Bacteroidota bacterium]